MLVILVLFSLLLPEGTWGATCERAQKAEAIAACLQALQKTPKNVDILLQYADILLDLDRPQEAIDLLETSHGKNSTNTAIRLKLSEAREAAVKPAKETGPSSRAMQKLSVVRCKTRMGQAALDFCNKALLKQPNNADLLTAKGNTLMSLKRPSEAVRAYRLALAQDKNDSEIRSKIKLAIAATPKPQEKKPDPMVVSSPKPLQVATQGRPQTDKPKVAVPETVEAEREILQLVRFSNAPITGGVSY